MINEKNRRDRLTRAIQALQSVMLPMESVERRGKGPSKAITVEHAVDYIVALQREIDGLRKENSTITRGAKDHSGPNSSSNDVANR